MMLANIRKRKTGTCHAACETEDAAQTPTGSVSHRQINRILCLLPILRTLHLSVRLHLPGSLPSSAILHLSASLPGSASLRVLSNSHLSPSFPNPIPTGCVVGQIDIASSSAIHARLGNCASTRDWISPTLLMKKQSKPQSGRESHHGRGTVSFLEMCLADRLRLRLMVLSLGKCGDWQSRGGGC